MKLLNWFICEVAEFTGNLYRKQVCYYCSTTYLSRLADTSRKCVLRQSHLCASTVVQLHNLDNNLLPT